MFTASFLFAALIAFLFTILLGGRYKRLGPWSRIEAFFVILFLATWGVSLWITPYGPLLFGVRWLSMLIVAAIFALLLASWPASPPRSANEALERANEQAGLERSVNAFFWVLVVVLIIVIISWFARPLPAY